MPVTTPVFGAGKQAIRCTDFTISCELRLLRTNATPAEAGNRRKYPNGQGVWPGTFDNLSRLHSDLACLTGSFWGAGIHNNRPLCEMKSGVAGSRGGRRLEIAPQMSLACLVF